jgi:hypothetical protein
VFSRKPQAITLTLRRAATQIKPKHFLLPDIEQHQQQEEEQDE